MTCEGPISLALGGGGLILSSETMVIPLRLDTPRDSSEGKLGNCEIYA